MIKSCLKESFIRNTQEKYASLEQENTAMFIETWESQAALEAHMQTPHFKKFISQSQPLMAKPTEIKVYSVEELA